MNYLYPAYKWLTKLDLNGKALFLKADKTKDTTKYDWTVEEIYSNCIAIKLKIGHVDFFVKHTKKSKLRHN